MVGKKGASGRRRSPGKESTLASKGGDGSTANSSAKRPTRAYSLPRTLLERLQKYPDGERSGIVEKALTRYLDFGDRFDEDHSRLTEAAMYVFLKRDLLEFRNEEIDGRLASLKEGLASVREELTSLQSDIGYVARVLEQLFAIRRYPIQVEVPDVQDFNELVHEASGEYLRNTGLLRPNLERREQDLKMAAQTEAFENRKAELQEVLDAMPFMSNPRFYIGPGLGGLALFDRDHRSKERLGQMESNFEVFHVQVYRGEASLHHSKTRPYCRFGPDDRREVEVVQGIDNVAKVLPALVADYLAFRKLDSVASGAASQKDGKLE